MPHQANTAAARMRVGKLARQPRQLIGSRIKENAVIFQTYRYLFGFTPESNPDRTTPPVRIPVADDVGHQFAQAYIDPVSQRSRQGKLRREPLDPPFQVP